MQKINSQGVSAVIMAGGEGSRLRPMTCSMPKPLVPLLNKPVIDYCVELLRNHGICDITTTLYYLSDMIESYMGDGTRYGVNISHSDIQSPIGTAGSVKAAVPNCKNTTLVVSGDTITDCDLSAAIAFHREKNAKVTLILKRVPSPTEYGVVLLNPDNSVQRFLEKPDKNELFSDLANTGMYIVEPDIIGMIPSDKPFDFSNDLFPALLKNNIPLYGYQTEQYWCDIGDIDQYAQAQRDMLDNKLSFSLPSNVKVVNGIYTEHGAKIANTALIDTPCYISSEAQIGEFAHVGEYTVIGSGSRLFPNASVKRSIIMHNAVIRSNSQLRGAIICDEAQIDEFAAVFESSVIGARAIIGNRATVSNGASVWTDKVIEPRQTITENRVWGMGKRISCCDNGITGYCDTDISPETAVRIGAAFAHSLPEMSTVAVASNGDTASSMLKRATISGIMSQGVDVYNLPHMPFSRFGFTVSNLELAGGMYIDTATNNPHMAHFTLCDHTGSAINSSARRKIMQLFKNGEVKPITHRALGIIEDIGTSKPAYDAALLKSINTKIIKNNPSIIVFDAPKEMFDSIASLMAKCAWQVIPVATNGGADMQKQMEQHSAVLGFLLESDTDMLIKVMTSDSNTISDMALLCLLMSAIHKGTGKNAFVVPISFPDEYSKYLSNIGVSLQSSPDDWHAWRKAAIQSDAYSMELFDPLCAMLKICELKAQNELDTYIADLPQTYITQNKLHCTWRDMGKILRSLTKSETPYPLETTDGIKIHTDSGWVLIKSDDSITQCRVICGSYKAEYADELCVLYTDRLRAMLAEKQ